MEQNYSTIRDVQKRGFFFLFTLHVYISPRQKSFKENKTASKTPGGRYEKKQQLRNKMFNDASLKWQ